MKNRSTIVGIVLGAILLLGGGIAAGYLFLPEILGSDEHDHSEEPSYFCPMHPQVTADEPGICPICNMDLVPVDEPEKMQEDMDGLVITPRDRVIADVKTVEVGYRGIGQDIVAPAVVEVNEATEKSITAWFPGRVDRLYAEKSGEYIRKGAPLAEIYSPELITAQQEYLIALETAERNLLPRLEGEPEGTAAGERLVEMSAERLRLLGMTNQQIDALHNEQKVARTTTIFSTASGIVTRKGIREGAYVEVGTTIVEVVDLSSVWIIASVPETSASSLRVGMEMAISLPGGTGDRRTARVDYIYPMVDRESRSVQVRGTISNPGLRLKPGMYLTAAITLPANDGLAVPIGAVIRTGERTVVYVEVEKNTFEAREVELGLKGDKFFQVTGGDLHQGDRVVAEGGYLLDAERQLTTSGGASDD